MYRYLYKNVHKKRIFYATTYSILKIYLRRQPLKGVKYNVCIQTIVKIHIFLQITDYLCILCNPYPIIFCNSMWWFETITNYV